MAEYRDDMEDSVAIIGLTGRFPGASNPDLLWDMLRYGKTGYKKFPKDHLERSIHRHHVDDPFYIPVGLPLDDYMCFDADFFRYSPSEAAFMDPQHRLLLECAWHTYETAGLKPGDGPGNRTGVFASVGANSYALGHVMPYMLRGDTDLLTAMMSGEKDYSATRIAHRLGLTGPALAIQTACSSSLVGTHLACQSLLSYEVDTALVVACSLPLPAELGYLHTPDSILSRDGFCRPFDVHSSGTVFGAGVAGVLLRRYKDAITGQDPILAVIRGSAVSNDGATRLGFVAPSIDGQMRVIGEALKMARVAPSDIGYVECHGTGTPLGDPVEVSALHRAFEGYSGPLPLGICPIGSIKSSIGHLDTVSGLAGLIKAVLMIVRGGIPAMATFSLPNPALSLERTPFRINRTFETWDQMPWERIVAVSSFGLGGTNAHLIVAGPQRQEEKSVRKSLPLHPFRRDVHWLPSCYDALIHFSQTLPPLSVVHDRESQSENSLCAAIPDNQSPYDPPQTELERQLAKLFEQALHVHSISRHADFFNLGGHSLISIDLARRASAWGLPLQSSEILEKRTIAALALHLDGKIKRQVKEKEREAHQSVLKAVAGRESELWFPYTLRRSHPRLRLFCLPFAGGGAEFYRSWHGILPEDIEIWPVQLPGRSSRIAESSIADLSTLTESLTAMLTPFLEDIPFALFGHSMGALLAFELAHNLPRSPQSLLLSGRQAPDCCLGQWKHTLSDRELIEELKAFGGTPPEILESPEILELILPVLRSDLKALDTYIFKKDRPLLTMDFLITCGRSDSLVPLASLQGWGKLTQGRVDTILWDGDHFYMQKDLSSYLNALRHWINHSLKVHVETREDMRKQA